ncbi:MAG TPA: lipocalin family protein [Candidatus Hydrogenedentes bacterium]|nr:lipocalin family protein [Candidatus Hydrogenedentota bacterium]
MKARKETVLEFLMTFPIMAASLCGCPKPAYDPPSASLAFPADHGFHYNKTEWVYFSGFVQTDVGKELGFMFTIFQIESVGNVNGGFIYPCLLIICDPENSTYHWCSTFGFNGSAGAVDGLPRINAKDAQFACLPSGDFNIQADMDILSLNLNFTPNEDVLLHGEDGIIPMGDGMDSGYYSFTNLSTNGTLAINGTDYTVTEGRAWMDHQWGNWADNGRIWDWFSMRFDNGGALMLFQFRDGNGNVVRGNWTYRDGDGEVRYGTDFSINAHRMYNDKDSSGSFPVDWTITIPSLNAEFEVKPLFDAQNVYSLWEGACTVEGAAGDSVLSGKAFVELTGYGNKDGFDSYFALLRLLLKNWYARVRN